MTDSDLPDDPFDPALAKRFEVLDSVEAPDNWPGRGSGSAPSRRRWLAAAAAVAVLAASFGWALTRSDDGEVIAGGDAGTTTTATAVAPPVTTAPASDCPVTQPPAEPFVPPEPWAPEPSIPGEVWFGDDDLWTVLDTDGHVARKSVWWSANFRGGGSEPVPEIAVIYERLDAPGMSVDLGPKGTNANTAADGWFMIAGGEPATPGCWQATATYKGATLSYVYEVPESAGFTECHDPQVAATTMAGSSNVEYDYQGSASPAELAASADHVVVGRVSGVGIDDGQAWIELSDLAPDSGLGSVIRVGYEFFASPDLDTDAIVGVRALAVLYDNDAAIGGLEVSLEGLWFSCDDDAVAYPAKLVPTRDGWPVEPSINQLLDLIADPPVLVDGPVVRRSGQRSFADAQFAAFGDESDGADELSLDGGCSWFVGGGGRTAIVWPPGTEHADGVVSFASGESAVDGSVLGFRGVMLDASLVRYEIGLAAGEAIETCFVGVSDAPVLVLDTVEVAEPSQSPADADRDGVVGALAALRNSDRVAVLVEAPASEGTWVLSRIPDDAIDPSWNGILGDPDGAYPVDHVYPFEYGEILLLDDDGRIVRAYPMPGAVPSWLLVTDEAILAGRIGDGGLPDSTFVRIDRGTLDADVLLIPASLDGGTAWPPSWRIATPEQVELFDTAVGFAPQGASGTTAVSWIGDVVVDLDRLAALADSAFE